MTAVAAVQGTPVHYRHVPKNILLILLSIVTLPISIILVCLGLLHSFTHSKSHQRSQPITRNHQPHKTILITGISTPAGLYTSRLLARYSPHHIIGADIEPIPFTSPSRYSRSLSKFLRLDAPEKDDIEPYIDSLLSIIKRERIDLWINYSTILIPTEDAEIKHLAQQIRGPSFKCLHFSPDTARQFSSPSTFTTHANSLGLKTLETHRCTTEEQVLDILSRDALKDMEKRRSMQQANTNGDRRKYIEFLGLATPESWRGEDEGEYFAFDLAERGTPTRSVRQSLEIGGQPQKTLEDMLGMMVMGNMGAGVVSEKKEHDAGKKFVLKKVGGEGGGRDGTEKDAESTLPLLPLPSEQETKRCLKTLKISPHNPYHLQQHIPGPQYTADALIISGHIATFLAHPSTSEPSLTYDTTTALSPSSPLSKKMFEYIETIARNGGQDFTGHLSVDFQADSGKEKKDEDAEIYAMRCTPRISTAMMLHSQSEQMARAYLSLLDDSKDATKLSCVHSQKPTPSYYWISYDLVTLVCIPILDYLFGHGNMRKEVVKNNTLDFWHRTRYWKDLTFVDWDPLPFLVLYHVYWPVQFLKALLGGGRWSTIDMDNLELVEE